MRVRIDYNIFPLVSRYKHSSNILKFDFLDVKLFLYITM